jgi:hypothetical protein
MDKNKILEDFQSEFKAPEIKDFETFLRVVNMNKQVRNWYSKQKLIESTLVEMPDSFKKAGVTTQMWMDLEAERNKLKDANKNYSYSVNEASKEFQQKLERADEIRLKSISSVSMLVKLTGFNVDNLPLNVQLEISNIKDVDERKRTVKERVDLYVCELVKKVLNNENIKDPFA